MEPRELPGRPEPALPLQSGLGAGYPSLQQVGCLRFSADRDSFLHLTILSYSPASLFFCPVNKFCKHNNAQSICETLRDNGSTVDLPIFDEFLEGQVEANETLSSPLIRCNLLKRHQRIEACSRLAEPITSAGTETKTVCNFLK